MFILNTALILMKILINLMLNFNLLYFSFRSNLWKVKLVLFLICFRRNAKAKHRALKHDIARVLHKVKVY